MAYSVVVTARQASRTPDPLAGLEQRIADLESVIADLQSREAARDPEYKPIVDLAKKAKESG